jgi:predicted AAA+ superfamily ATPase
MKKYTPRIADRIIAQYLKTFGAVIIEGARATGKTTTAKHASRSEVSLDKSPTLTALAQTDPSTVFQGEKPRLIDEWQLAPNIWNAVRHEVDERGEPGKFILTGSATPNDDITRHSGAGRFGRIKLHTMSLYESGLSTGAINFRDLFIPDYKPAAIEGPNISTYSKSIIKGGWPRTQDMPEDTASLYLTSYIEDIVRVDIDGARDPERVKSLIRSLSRNISTEATLKGIAGEAKILNENATDDTNQGVSIPTARKYLNGLNKIFILEELPPWSTHIRSKVRQRVSPKWHFVDPSLAAASLQLSSRQLLDDLNAFGLFFESLCIRDLRIFAELLHGTVSYYRDEKNLEVDAIVELFDGKWAGFEIKLGGDNFINEGANNLLALYNKLPESKQKDMMSLNVLTGGGESYRRADGINVLSIGHMGIEVE